MKNAKHKKYRVPLGGGFTCIKCGIGHYNGYAPNQDKQGHWRPSKLTLPCTHCGFQAPASMSQEDFMAAIHKRDNDPEFIKQMDEYISKIIAKKQITILPSQ